MSTYNDLLDTVLTTVQGLNLMIGEEPFTNIVLKKLPAIQNGLDTLPIIIICPTMEGEKVERLGFVQHVTVAYGVNIIVAAGGDMDFTSTMLPTYLQWRETIRTNFQEQPLANWINPDNNSILWNVRVEPLSPLERSVIVDLYDYMGLTVKFDISEVSV